MPKDTLPTFDEERMDLAIEEAWKARLVAPPNPWVGALLDTGSLLICGHTHDPGGPHAEVDAINKAGSDSLGGTLYVTLEPCAHHGRTPPCAAAIVDAGIKRVVIGVVDPDSRVSGRGIQFLRSNGVDVAIGIRDVKIKQQLAPYLKQRSTSIPWVVLKLAVTLDGRIAANDGSSNWITGDEARQRVQEIRAFSDAIVVGANTVRVDNPRLSVRIPGVERQPRRIVLGKIPASANVNPAEEFQGEESDLLASLGNNEVLQVLIEGGSKVSKNFLCKDLIDEFIFHIAPAVYGGSDGISAFGGHGAMSINEIKRLETKEVRSLGNDTEIILWSKRATDLIEQL